MTSKLRGLMERHVSFPRRWLRAYLEPLDTPRPVAVAIKPVTDTARASVAAVLASDLARQFKANGVSLSADGDVLALSGVASIRPSLVMFLLEALLIVIDAAGATQSAIVFPEVGGSRCADPVAADGPLWVVSRDGIPCRYTPDEEEAGRVGEAEQARHPGSVVKVEEAVVESPHGETL